MSEVAEENDTVVLRVEDNGKGMPPEIVAKAFDPFYTEPGKHDKRKVGMGLPFVKQTCDGCGGVIASGRFCLVPGIGPVMERRLRRT